MTRSRPLWQYGEPWTDFRPALLGEASGPVSFVTVNRSLYVLDVAGGWFRRGTNVAWNSWTTDGFKRPLLRLVTASSCGIRLQRGILPGEFVSTTAVIAAYAGEVAELPNDELPDVRFEDWTCPNGHPEEPCGAMNCAVRPRGFVVVLAESKDGAADVR